jgi:hypothetical protein
MAAPLPSAELQFLDGNGHPYSGGSLQTLIPGTLTLKATWQDAAASALNTNPIVLDAAGRCVVWGDGQYRFILKDAAGTLIYDQVSSTAVSAAMAPVCLAPDIATAAGLLGMGGLVSAEAGLRVAGDAAEAAARAAADSAEASARLSADTALSAAIVAEHDRAVLAEGAGGTPARIEHGFGITNGDGIAIVTFATAFATPPTIVASVGGTGFMAFMILTSSTTTSGEVHMTVRENNGSATPVAGYGFHWIAVGN